MCCRDAILHWVVGRVAAEPCQAAFLSVLRLVINIQPVLQVFEYMETDLEIVIKDKNVTLGPSDVKAYLQMLLKGLGFCHSRWVLHRDVKPNNFLIAASGELCRHARALWQSRRVPHRDVKFLIAASGELRRPVRMSGHGRKDMTLDQVYCGRWHVFCCLRQASSRQRGTPGNHARHCCMGLDLLLRT